jgi:hypothetical protein
MKIRIKGNSIRLRLTKSEVAALSKDDSVIETIDFGNSQLHYSVTTGNNDHPNAIYGQNRITIILPKSFTSTWHGSEDVGIQHIQKNVNGSELLLLIEKDFVCLDRTFEDQSDNYENPRC